MIGFVQVRVLPPSEKGLPRMDLDTANKLSEVLYG